VPLIMPLSLSSTLLCRAALSITVRWKYCAMMRAAMIFTIISLISARAIIAAVILTFSVLITISFSIMLPCFKIFHYFSRNIAATISTFSLMRDVLSSLTTPLTPTLFHVKYFHFLRHWQVIIYYELFFDITTPLLFRNIFKAPITFIIFIVIITLRESRWHYFISAIFIIDTFIIFRYFRWDYHYHFIHYFHVSTQAFSSFSLRIIDISRHYAIIIIIFISLLHYFRADISCVSDIITPFHFFHFLRYDILLTKYFRGYIFSRHYEIFWFSLLLRHFDIDVIIIFVNKYWLLTFFIDITLYWCAITIIIDIFSFFHFLHDYFHFSLLRNIILHYYYFRLSLLSLFHDYCDYAPDYISSYYFSLRIDSPFHYGAFIIIFIIFFTMISLIFISFLHYFIDYAISLDIISSWHLSILYFAYHFITFLSWIISSHYFLRLRYYDDEIRFHYAIFIFDDYRFSSFHLRHYYFHYYFIIISRFISMQITDAKRHWHFFFCFAR